MAGPHRLNAEGGYAMAALLVAMTIMAIGLTMLMPAWQTMVQREREAELVFRGEQYAKAVARFQRARGAFPPSVDVLVSEKFLRKKYKDPMTENGEFQVITVGQPIPGGATPPVTGRGAQQPGAQQPGGRGVQPGLAPGTPAPQSGFTPVTRPGTGVGGGPVLGVVSRSTQTSLRLYNGRNKYNEWAFVAAEATTQAGGGGRGTQQPGGRGTQNPGGRGGTQNPFGPRGGTGGGGLGGGGGLRGGGGGAGGRGMGTPGGLQLPPRGGGQN